MLSSTLFALTTVLPLAQAASYSLQTTYAGQSFFDGFDFDEIAKVPDLNYGNAAFLDRGNSTQKNLISINSAGNAILRVDNETKADPNDMMFGRNSVNITSQAKINSGSLVIFDAAHMPFGCSVWPAFYLIGEGSPGIVWPTNGEIDIVENVNLETSNQYSLHTLDGCNHPAAADSAKIQTSTVVSPNCFVNASATIMNQGCVMKETKTGSFGQNFNANGGGVFATLYDSTGISIWFWARKDVPSDATGNNPNPSSWSTPSAYWPSSSCDISKFFGPLTMVLNIQICGAFAGGAFPTDGSCHATKCSDLVKDPTNYNDAWWEVKSVKVFSDGSSSSGSPSGSKTGSGSGTGATNGASPTHTPGTAFRTATATGGWSAAVLVLTTGLAFVGAFFAFSA